MNRDCNGTFYEVGTTQFYRCFLDGAVMKASTIGAYCPNCGRTIADTVDRGKVQTRRIVRVEVLLTDGWALHHQETQ